jgi:hypothetical protein
MRELCAAICRITAVPVIAAAGGWRLEFRNAKNDETTCITRLAACAPWLSASDIASTGKSGNMLAEAGVPR